MNREAILCEIIDFFQQREKRTNKILLQKALYFLNYRGMDSGYVFEGYLYGPYCREAAEDASQLSVDGIFSYDGTYFDTGFDFGKREASLKINGTDKGKIDRLLNEYWEEILDHDASFKNVELMGTVMYVIKNTAAPLLFSQVWEGVKKWKRDKFTEEEVRKAFDKVNPLN